MASATNETMEIAKRRAERLAIMLGSRLDGENVPDELLDEAVDLISESVEDYRRERAAGSN